jgi:hypothetical protein
VRGCVRDGGGSGEAEGEGEVRERLPGETWPQPRQKRLITLSNLLTNSTQLVDRHYSRFSGGGGGGGGGGSSGSGFNPPPPLPYRDLATAPVLPPRCGLRSVHLCVREYCGQPCGRGECDCAAGF